MPLILLPKVIILWDKNQISSITIYANDGLWKPQITPQVRMITWLLYHPNTKTITRTRQKNIKNHKRDSINVVYTISIWFLIFFLNHSESSLKFFLPFVIFPCILIPIIINQKMISLLDTIYIKYSIIFNAITTSYMDLLQKNTATIIILHNKQ